MSLLANAARQPQPAAPSSVDALSETSATESAPAQAAPTAREAAAQIVDHVVDYSRAAGHMLVSIEASLQHYEGSVSDMRVDSARQRIAHVRADARFGPTMSAELHRLDVQVTPSTRASVSFGAADVGVSMRTPDGALGASARASAAVVYTEVATEGDDWSLRAGTAVAGAGVGGSLGVRDRDGDGVIEVCADATAAWWTVGGCVELPAGLSGADALGPLRYLARTAELVNRTSQ